MRNIKFMSGVPCVCAYFIYVDEFRSLDHCYEMLTYISVSVTVTVSVAKNQKTCCRASEFVEFLLWNACAKIVTNGNGTLNRPHPLKNDYQKPKRNVVFHIHNSETMESDKDEENGQRAIQRVNMLFRGKTYCRLS